MTSLLSLQVNVSLVRLVVFIVYCISIKLKDFGSILKIFQCKHSASSNSDSIIFLSDWYSGSEIFLQCKSFSSSQIEMDYSVGYNKLEDILESQLDHSRRKFCFYLQNWWTAFGLTGSEKDMINYFISCGINVGSNS